MWRRVAEANRPGPPEHSIAFRAASVAALLFALACAAQQHELSLPVALGAAAITVVGNVFSYRRRSDPLRGTKAVLAITSIAAFAWFAVVARSQATPGDISSVEAPLAVLFAWILSTHAFDVPARRDVVYTVAGSTGLVAVASAHAVDLGLAPYVALWAAAVLYALVAMWASMDHVRGVPWSAVATSVTGLTIVALVVLTVVPAPSVSTALAFPSSSAGDSPVTASGGLTDGSAASLPAHSARPSGPTRVGGYLGFAKSLDTGVRAALSNQVVLRVRTNHPGYWVGQTFDTWDGVSWTETPPSSGGPKDVVLTGGSPFTIPVTPDELATEVTPVHVVTTFYLAQDGPNVVFHSGTARAAYVATPRLRITGDGALVSASTMGAGTVYTVVSDDTEATATELRSVTARDPLTPGPSNAIDVPPAFDNGAGAPGAPGTPGALSEADRARYLQLPADAARAGALARQIADQAGIGTDAVDHPYDAITAIDAWIAANTRYSVDIPPLQPGQDSVDEFLFGNRIGFCEQISTASVVMLRSLGIPAREATGYVPGNYNPITDLFDVPASNAHAWVQVYFPGYGWQNFDPTANVPLANPSPGSVLWRSIGRAAARLPWPGIGAALLAGSAFLLWRRSRRRRPRTWTEAVLRNLVAAAASAGVPRSTATTAMQIGNALADRLADVDVSSADVARRVTDAYLSAVYGGHEPAADDRARLVAESSAVVRAARALAQPRRRRGMRARTGGGGSGLQPTAIASSNDAPASRSGR